MEIPQNIKIEPQYNQSNPNIMHISRGNKICALSIYLCIEHLYSHLHSISHNRLGQRLTLLSANERKKM